jgi:hypothetical protein
MKIGKILSLSFLLFVLVAIVNHQLAQNSKQALNTSLITTAQAQGTPTSTPTPTATPTPTPTPSPTPGIGQSCTPGFYKNHPEFITGCGITGPDETLATLGLNNLANCNHNGVVFPLGNLDLLHALGKDTPASFCGAGTLAQKELNLLRQVVAAVLNGANSNPQACGAASDIIKLANAAIAQAANGDDSGLATLQSSLEKNINNDKFGSLCGGS